MDNGYKVSNKEIIHQLINSTVKHRKIMQYYLDETGVYHAQYRLLVEISRNPNISQIDIARMMDVSAATIAVSLKKLEREGYITRDRDADDNRLNKISVTEKGNRVVEQGKRVVESTHQKVFEGFTEEDKSALSGLLKKLEDNLARIEDEISLKKERTEIQKGQNV